VEVVGDDFDDIVKTAVQLKNYLDSKNIPGVEKLKLDVDITKPELTLIVDRERAMREGLSTDRSVWNFVQHCLVVSPVN